MTREEMVETVAGELYNAERAERINDGIPWPKWRDALGAVREHFEVIARAVIAREESLVATWQERIETSVRVGGEMVARIKRLEAALVELERLHPDDSYGNCVTCFEWNTDESHQGRPCATLRVARALEGREPERERCATCGHDTILIPGGGRRCVDGDREPKCDCLNFRPAAPEPAPGQSGQGGESFEAWHARECVGVLGICAGEIRWTVDRPGMTSQFLGRTCRDVHAAERVAGERAS